jgi:hypothetical protein
VPSSFASPPKYLQRGSPLFDGFCCEQAMGVAPVGLTFWRLAAGSAAVQTAPVPPLSPRLLTGQGIPPLRATPGRPSQVLRLSRVPFHRVDPRSRERPCPDGVADCSYNGLPPALTFSRSTCPPSAAVRRGGPLSPEASGSGEPPGIASNVACISATSHRSVGLCQNCQNCQNATNRGFWQSWQSRAAGRLRTSGLDQSGGWEPFRHSL